MEKWDVYDEKRKPLFSARKNFEDFLFSRCICSAALLQTVPAALKGYAPCNRLGWMVVLKTVLGTS